MPQKHADPSLGVDVVEFKKADSFYKNHGGRLERFFAPEEVSTIRQSERPSESLAFFFAAKEAVFKTLGLRWMGMDGFRDIRIAARGRNASFSLYGRFRTAPARPSDFKLFFRKTRRYVVAFCVPGSFA